MPEDIFAEFDKSRIGDGLDIVIGIRPENLSVSDEGTIACHVDVLEELGSESLLYGNLDLESEKAVVNELNNYPVTVKMEARSDVKINTVVKLAADYRYVHLFEKSNGVSLLTKYADYAANYADKMAKEEEARA